MKKFLCSLIAISLIISMLPAAFADGETTEQVPVAKTYMLNRSAIGIGRDVGLSTIGKDAVNDSGENIYESSYWRYFDMPEAVKEKESAESPLYAAVSKPINSLIFNTGEDFKFALMLKAPDISGFYIPSIFTLVNEKTSRPVKVYMSKYDETKIKYDMYTEASKEVMSTTATKWKKEVHAASKAVYTTSSEPVVSAIDGVGKLRFYNITLNPVQNPKIEIAIDDAELNTTDNKTTTITSTTVSGKVTFDVYDTETEKTIAGEEQEVSTPVAGGFVTYYCEDVDGTNVITVNAETGAIEAQSAGEAKVWAETPDGAVKSTPVTVTVTAPSVEPEEPGEEVTDTDKSVSVMPENSSEGIVEGLENIVDEVAMGTTINPTAVPAEGYKFAYWKDSSGTVLSTNPNEKFVINTNTAIIAVFDKITPESKDKTTVELYNANGMLFHKNENVALNTPFSDVATAAGRPSLTGYVFKHWSMYANEAKIEDSMPITALIRAVAIYDELEAQYTVKVGGTDVVENKKYKYGEEVTVTGGEDLSCWKLGDKVVSYSKNYTFSVWGNVDLTEVTDVAVTEAPIATLVKDGENHLLIYSVPAGYTKVEAGIIFSKNAEITVDSFDGKKASEVRGTGQFMVSSDFTYARGYLIFKNNTSEEIRILYAD